MSLLNFHRHACFLETSLSRRRCPLNFEPQFFPTQHTAYCTVAWPLQDAQALLDFGTACMHDWSALPTESMSSPLGFFSSTKSL